MSKSMAPKSTRKREKCKCGMLYYNRLVGSSLKTADACTICKPIKEEEEKRK